MYLIFLVAFEPEISLWDSDQDFYVRTLTYYDILYCIFQSQIKFWFHFFSTQILSDCKLVIRRLGRFGWLRGTAVRTSQVKSPRLCRSELHRFTIELCHVSCTSPRSTSSTNSNNIWTAKLGYHDRMFLKEHIIDFKCWCQNHFRVRICEPLSRRLQMIMRSGGESSNNLVCSKRIWHPKSIWLVKMDVALSIALSLLRLPVQML